MLPPLLEIYVVWHPDDERGAAIADDLIDHFHGTAFSGLIGGAIELFVRSVGWADPTDAPRPLPYVEDLPSAIPEAKLTVVVPVLGLGLATAVEDGTPWREYIEELRTGASSRPAEVCVRPVRLSNMPSDGVLADAFRIPQAIEVDDALTRELSQAIAQFASDSETVLKVFISHTKHFGDGRLAETLVRRIRDLIADTKLDSFFDAHDLQAGSDWAQDLIDEASTSALLAIRTDLYATREWCQREVLTAKRAGMPVVTLDAVEGPEERGSFLMDHAPRVPLRTTQTQDEVIIAVLNQLVDECLKRILWRRQEQLAIEEGMDVASWWAPHAPEPTTLVAWLQEAGTMSIPPSDQLLILHPDPPLGPDEVRVLQEMLELSGRTGPSEFLTPRGLAIRGV